MNTSLVIGIVVAFLVAVAVSQSLYVVDQTETAIVLQLGMDANDMKLLSAIIVAAALCVPVVWERTQRRRAYSKGGEQ